MQFPTVEMWRQVGRTLLLTVLLLAPSAAGAEGGEISLFGSQIRADCGSGVDCDRQSTLVRYLVGDATQLRVDLELARVRGSGGDFVSTPLGPVPIRGPNPQPGETAPGPGPAGPGSGAAGPGAGAGQEPSTDGAVQDAVGTGTGEWRSGVGDLRVAVTRLLAGGGARVYRLDAAVGVKAPTASDTDGLGTGEWDYRLGFSGEYRFWSATAFGGMGWNRLGDPEWVRLADVIDGYVGVERELPGERWVVSGWLEGNEEIVQGDGSRSALGVGVRSGGTWRWRAQLVAGLGGSAEDLSVLTGFSHGVRAPVIGTRTIR